MGLVSDMLTNFGMDATPPVDAQQRRAYRELKEIVDEGDIVLSTAMTAADEVQSMAVYSPAATGGTFTLTINFASGESTTTAAIAWNAAAAAIETAIDVAATAEPITGWTNGDISVSGGDLTTAPVVFTFDGTSVDELNHPLIVADGALLTPTADSDGAITVTTYGQPNRPGYTILSSLSIVGGTIPAYGVTPTALVAAAPLGGDTISEETVRLVATYTADMEVAASSGDAVAIYTAIVTAAGAA
ncbi:MAG: hypothetical protein ACYTFQ_17895 [Planctomycetota bacterium]|jgi:hypothetical protein